MTCSIIFEKMKNFSFSCNKNGLVTRGMLLLLPIKTPHHIQLIPYAQLCHTMLRLLYIWIWNFHITPIFLSLTLESQILIVFNMFNVTGKSQKVRYEYHFLNVRQVSRYTCRKFEISHGGSHGGALRTFWYILMLKYRNIVFQSENSILEGMNSYSAPPHAPPHVMSWIFHIFYVIPILH